jgi:hypothetical protein
MHSSVTVRSVTVGSSKNREECGGSQAGLTHTRLSIDRYATLREFPISLLSPSLSLSRNPLNLSINPSCWAFPSLSFSPSLSESLSNLSINPSQLSPFSLSLKSLSQSLSASVLLAGRGGGQQESLGELDQPPSLVPHVHPEEHVTQGRAVERYKLN